MPLFVMSHRLLSLGLALGLCLGLPAQASAPQSTPVTAPAAAMPTVLRLAPGEAAPALDGHLDEPAWLRAPVYERFVQFLPADKQAARWRTSTSLAASSRVEVV